MLRNVQRRWPDHAGPWTTRVEDELRELCSLYRATPRRALPARYGYVIAVDTTHGPLVMRASPDPNGPNQARVAATLADLRIAPTVHETINTGHGTWTVLDEIQPGTPLGETDQSRATMDSLAGLLSPMDIKPQPVSGMPTIVDWLRHRLEAGVDDDLAPHAKPATGDERRGALTLLDQLARDATPRLCHGDLTPWNILAHGATAWMLVDPRGMSGELSYDVAVLALKTALGEAPAAVAAQLANAVGVDTERARAWTLVADAARV